jgi:hypothetical protein
MLDRHVTGNNITFPIIVRPDLLCHTLNFIVSGKFVSFRILQVRLPRLLLLLTFG